MTAPPFVSAAVGATLSARHHHRVGGRVPLAADDGVSDHVGAVVVRHEWEARAASGRDRLTVADVVATNVRLPPLPPAVRSVDGNDLPGDRLVGAGAQGIATGSPSFTVWSVGVGTGVVPSPGSRTSLPAAALQIVGTHAAAEDIVAGPAVRMSPPSLLFDGPEAVEEQRVIADVRVDCASRGNCAQGRIEARVERVDRAGAVVRIQGPSGSSDRRPDRSGRGANVSTST